MIPASLSFSTKLFGGKLNCLINNDAFVSFPDYSGEIKARLLLFKNEHLNHIISNKLKRVSSSQFSHVFHYFPENALSLWHFI